MAENKKYKVIIPTAGVGSRLGNHCDHVNKTLVPVANKPILSYIIEKFSKDVDIIIDLGYKGELVKEFLELAYPERKFTFVWANRNGLTSDLCDYEQMLQCPFIFFTNDAIVEESVPPPDHNWIGYASVPAGQDYRSIVFDSWDNQLVSKVEEKGIHTEAPSYIGICGIKDYKIFWDRMRLALENGTKNQGESFSLSAMAESGLLKGKEFSWYDTGTTAALKHANKVLSTGNDMNILPKEQEHIWFCNGKVIKFSTDKTFISDRVKRAKLLEGYVPEIIGQTEHMYSYNMVEGEIFSKTVNVPRLKNLMFFIEKLWGKQTCPSKKQIEVYRKFYEDKTRARVSEYFRRFDKKDSEHVINGVRVPTIEALLSKVDWTHLSEGHTGRVHGDLHFENIIDTIASFCLLDWRQDFGGLDKYGDIYYDLAKLWHGLIVSHSVINNNMYEVNYIDDINESLPIVNFELMRKQTLIDCEEWLGTYIEKNDYDLNKVKILTALIYLNIACLHHTPYAEMLFYLGKYMLNNLLKEQSHG